MSQAAKFTLDKSKKVKSEHPEKQDIAELILFISGNVIDTIGHPANKLLIELTLLNFFSGHKKVR